MMKQHLQVSLLKVFSHELFSTLLILPRLGPRGHSTGEGGGILSYYPLRLWFDLKVIAVLACFALISIHTAMAFASMIKWQIIKVVLKLWNSSLFQVFLFVFICWEFSLFRNVMFFPNQGYFSQYPEVIYPISYFGQIIYGAYSVACEREKSLDFPNFLLGLFMKRFFYLMDFRKRVIPNLSYWSWDGYDE